MVHIGRGRDPSTASCINQLKGYVDPPCRGRPLQSWRSGFCPKRLRACLVSVGTPERGQTVFHPCRPTM